MCIFTLKTKNENATIFQSQANDEKTFVFVIVKKMNDSMKKKIQQNKFQIKCLKPCILNFKNCLMFIFADFRKIINQTAIFFYLFRYFDYNIFSFSTVIRIDTIRTQFISTFIKSSISISFVSLILFEAVLQRRESLSTIL